MWAFAWQNLVTRPMRTALAVVGLTIPVLAFLRLVQHLQGIRDLMGNTLGKMQGLMVLRENSPSPVFSDLPATWRRRCGRSGGALVAPRSGRSRRRSTGKGASDRRDRALDRPREETLKSIASMT